MALCHVTFAVGFSPSQLAHLRPPGRAPAKPQAQPHLTARERAVFLGPILGSSVHSSLRASGFYRLLSTYLPQLILPPPVLGKTAFAALTLAPPAPLRAHSAIHIARLGTHPTMHGDTSTYTPPPNAAAFTSCINALTYCNILGASAVTTASPTPLTT